MTRDASNNDSPRSPDQGHRSQDARRSRSVAWATASTSVLFGLAILFMVNYLAARHYERFDWTAQGLFTLSDKSEKVLDKLDTDVDVYLFMSMGEPSFAEIKELLERYRARTGRLKVHYVDPDRAPSEFRLLAQRFGLGVGQLETGELAAEVAAVIAAGDTTWSIKREDFSQVDLDSIDSAGGPKLSVRAEQALTGAIVQVTSGRPTRLCFTKGHGEWSLGGSGERSLDGLEQTLRHDNVEFDSIETLGKKTLPEGCDAIYVIGPLRPFAQEEVALLEGYVRNGGNLLLALDPVIERNRVYPTGFEEFAASIGMQIDASLVLEMDPQRLISQNAVEFRVMDFDPRHETTQLLSALGGAVFMQLARSVRVDPDGEAQALLLTSAEAFAKTNIAALTAGNDSPVQSGEDVAGPVTLAAAVRVAPKPADGSSGAAALQHDADDDEADPDDHAHDDHGHDHDYGVPSAERPPHGGRVIIVGDSDWMMGPLLEAPVLANRELATAWTGWLTERDTLISIPPKQASLGYVNFDQDALSAVFFRVVVLIPLATMLLGLAVWWSRRS